MLTAVILGLTLGVLGMVGWHTAYRLRDELRDAERRLLEDKDCRHRILMAAKDGSLRVRIEDGMLVAERVLPPDNVIHMDKYRSSRGSTTD